MDAVRIPPSYTQPMKEFFLPTDEAPPTDSAGDVFTGSVLNSLRHDIQEVYLPSWLEKPPSNIGEAGHGKLQADHWRTLCTVYLVITLGRLWGPRSTPPIQAQALENFMHLIAAVDLATRRSMDTERANLFDAHMEAYLKRTTFIIWCPPSSESPLVASSQRVSPLVWPYPWLVGISLRAIQRLAATVENESQSMYVISTALTLCQH